MDNYSVKLLSRALRDLDGIYAYIAKTLQEPETALHIVEELEAQILSLETDQTHRSRNFSHRTL